MDVALHARTRCERDATAWRKVHSSGFDAQTEDNSRRLYRPVDGDFIRGYFLSRFRARISASAVDRSVPVPMRNVFRAVSPVALRHEIRDTLK